MPSAGVSTSLFQSQVHVTENAPWLATYLNELLGFPNAAHDDQADSTSQALNWLTARAPRNRPIVERNTADPKEDFVTLMSLMATSRWSLRGRHP
jgi:hypothetical protein